MGLQMSPFRMCQMPNLIYLTGYTALNIPYRGCQPDWHQSDMLKSQNFQICGENYAGAPFVFDDRDELFDCSNFLKSRGLEFLPPLCATPVRASIDIVFNSLVKGKVPLHFDPDDMDIELLDLVKPLSRLKKGLDDSKRNLLNQWLILVGISNV